MTPHLKAFATFMLMITFFLGPQQRATAEIDWPQVNEIQPDLCDVEFDPDALAYQKLAMVIAPMEVDARLMVQNLSYRREGPLGQQINGEHELVAAMSKALFQTDYPQQRFVSVLSEEALTWEAAGNLTLLRPSPNPETQRTLNCARVVILPALTDLQVNEKITERERTDKAGKVHKYNTYDYKIEVELSIRIFQRQNGQLVQTHLERARSTALTSDVPGNKALRFVNLSEAHSRSLSTQIESSGLHLTTQRPLTVLPTINEAAVPPATSGIWWRSLEARTLELDTHPKQRYDPVDIEQEAFRAVDDCLQILRLKTQKVFPLFDGLIADFNSTRFFFPKRFQAGYLGNIDQSDGVRLADLYWLCPAGDKKNPRNCGSFAKVRQVNALLPEGLIPLTVNENSPVLSLEVEESGPNSNPVEEEGPFAVAPLQQRAVELEIIGGKRQSLTENADSLVAIENPNYGVDISLSRSKLPAHRGAATLPPNPLTGSTSNRYVKEDEDITALELGLAFEAIKSNRFIYTRGALGLAGQLSVLRASFGLEQRKLVLARTYLYATAGITASTWQLPSGEKEYDEDLESYEEIDAEAFSIGAEAAVGTAIYLSPTLYLQAFYGVQAATAVSSFSTDTKTYTFYDEDDNKFRVSPTGQQWGIRLIYAF